MELEIKLKLKRDITENIKNIGFKYIKETHQIDTYYIVNEYYQSKQTYLRIREDVINKTYSFDLHQIHSDIATKEYEIQMNKSNINTAKNIIEILGFNEKCKIDKERKIYKKEDIIIVIDKVKELGDFIEIEIQSEPSKENEEKLFNIMNQLNLTKDDIISGIGYPDLFLQQKSKQENS